MARLKEPINPFYLLSGIFGAGFTLTACAYCVFMYVSNKPTTLGGDAHPLLRLMEQHGLTILAVQVVVLGIVSVAAITLDHCRGRRLAKEMRARSAAASPREPTAPVLPKGRS